MTTANTTYAVGDRVLVTLPQTNEQAAPATIEKAASGWFVCKLDRPDLFPLAKGGIVSARKDRMTPLAAGDAKQVDALTPEQVKAIKAEQADTPEMPDECPECGGSDIDLNDTNGYVCLECGHEWAGPEIDGEYHPDLDEDGNPIPMDEDALDEAEEHASKMAEALRKARARYTKARRPSGAATAHSGDAIAKELLDHEPLEVADLADRCLNLPKGTHATKYSHLNNGQIRMNSGNKIRGAWKKALATLADNPEDGAALAVKARIEYVLGLETEEEQTVEE